MFRRFLSRCGVGRSKVRQANSRPRSWSRRGFGILETIIAMTVIVLVSATAITIVLSSIRMTQKTVDREKAEYFSHDSIEAFRISEDEAGFKNLMEFAGYNLTEDGTGGYTYAFDSGYEATITADYTQARPTFQIRVMDGEEEITYYTFSKGGAA